MPHHLTADQLANLELRAERGQNPEFGVVAKALHNLAAQLYYDFICVCLVAGGSASRERAVESVERLPGHPSLDQLLEARTTALLR